MTENSSPKSPLWSGQTKLVVSLTTIALTSILVLNSLGIIGPLLLAFTLAYVFYPVAKGLQRLFKSWRVSVTLLYFIIVLLLIGLLTWGSITLIEQAQNLVNFLQKALLDLPNFVKTLSEQPIIIGPIKIFLNQFDLSTLTQQLLGLVQPLLSQAGSLVSTIASSAATVAGWLIFAIVVSYFILAGLKGNPIDSFSFQFPGYEEDIKRLFRELSVIWNAFLRGQITVTFAAIFLHWATLAILGVNFAIGLAVISGIIRFIPIIGSPISWIVFGAVSFFQGTTAFGLEPAIYMIIVLIISIICDTLLDNAISPYIFSNALRVHPAALLVASLIALNWLGFIGLILSAPAFASLKLFTHYIFHKMRDKDPWEHLDTIPAPRRTRFKRQIDENKQPQPTILSRSNAFWRSVVSKITRKKSD
jgi:predicted PurR-regulated permease PerM